MVQSLAELKRMVFPGESGGDYDALFGFSNRQGGAFAGVRPTQMTINEVIAFTDPSGPYGQWVKGQIGRVATPVGGFQVVGSTLRDTVKRMGLTGNEMFTPAVQDAIGMWIYQNQGPGAWEAWGKSGGGGSGSRSSGSGTMPMGLFDMQEEPQTFGQRLREGVRGGGLVDALALAANSLRMNPDPNIATMVQARQERRGEERTNNRTAQWLMTQNRADLAQALMTGALDAKTAVATALQKPDKANVMEVGGKLIDETGKVIYDPTGGAEPVLSSDQLSGLNTLRDDATQATKELSMMRDAWNSINTFYQNPGSVSDRALVIAFAKVLDPTSVVRESESAAIANSGSLSAGLRSTLLNTLQGGGNLPDDIRDEILNLSREMYGQKLPSVQQQIQLLQDTAARAGLPPELVFSGDLTAPAQLPAVRTPSSFVPAGPPGRI
jgi:hypothetical protein